MLNALIPYALRLRQRYPALFSRIVSLAKRFMGKRLGVYPRPLSDEIAAVAAVLRSSRWNMTAGAGLPHERLEAEFAEYVGVQHAVAVNTGGMALQMSIRGLGLKPGDEVVLQVDTCSATALAIIAAGCAPVFADVCSRTMMLDAAAVERSMGPRTRAIIATHMWGNPEDIAAIQAIADKYGIPIVEDACLSLGAKLDSRMVGSFGKVGVFSFGCIKPIQAGEGGMIVTNDASLARELRSMRHWGDRTIEFGVRDTLHPAWNGRMSEIVAAVVRSQLKGYPSHLVKLRSAMHQFGEFLEGFDGLELVLGNADAIDACAFTQCVLRLDEARAGYSKTAFVDFLKSRGVPTWHANFELINTLSLFRNANWEPWLAAGDVPRLRANYEAKYLAATRLYASTGIGLGKMNFLSSANLRYLMKQLEGMRHGTRL